MTFYTNSIKIQVLCVPRAVKEEPLSLYGVEKNIADSCVN